MDFKDKVKKVRAELFLTQEQLSKELGCSFSTVNRWEMGKKQPKFLSIKKFEQFCRNKKIEFKD